MSHKLNDITIYHEFEDDRAKNFGERKHIISDLYVQYLNGYKPPKTSRITVDFAKKDEIIGYFGSILHVQIYFDTEKYLASSENQKNKIILNTIHKVALMCTEKFDWEKDYFLNAYNRVIQANFKYQLQRKIKNSRDRKHKATIELTKDYTCTTISVVFYDNDNNKIKTVEVLKSFLYELSYGGIIKKYKWFNNREFGLYTKNEELTLRASLDHDKAEININPINSDKEILEGYLRRITYRAFKNNKEYVEWVSK